MNLRSKLKIKNYLNPLKTELKFINAVQDFDITTN